VALARFGEASDEKAEEARAERARRARGDAASSVT